MKIHEYQAKEVFARYGIPVPPSRLASSAEEASQATQDLGGKAVLKAQVHAGGRGQGGGIKVVNSPDEARPAAAAMLGANLVTHQTGPEGAPVSHVLVEELADISRELYLAITIDRDFRGPVMLASSAGGMDIEEAAASRPQDIHVETIDPVLGLMPFQTRRLAAKLGLSGSLAQPGSQIMNALYRVFTELDCSLVEINPMIINSQDELVALDAKINLDDDSLFRHTDLQELRDPAQEDELEYRAASLDIAYVKLDGDVGCLVNGAGLAMATLDVTTAAGAMPANFLDVGGGATPPNLAPPRCIKQ
jgi:succinyl-CoA synthetase beta subunit